MKKVRMFSIAMAVVMLLTAVFPAAPAAAREVDFAVSDGERAVQVLPATATYSLPEVTMWVESNNGAYGCTLVKQSPGDWIDMKPRQSFDAAWTVKNTGGAIWPAGQTRFAYVGGTKMQTRGDSFTLSQSVGRGGKMTFAVDMVAPKTPGVYSTLWAVYAGNTRFCKVTLTLSVTR